MDEKEIKEWFGQAIWIYPADDKQFLEILEKNLKAKGFKPEIWQTEKPDYHQYLCSVDLMQLAGDTVHFWRDGQTYWPLSGDYSVQQEEDAELVLRQTCLEWNPPSV